MVGDISGIVCFTGYLGNQNTMREKGLTVNGSGREKYIQLLIHQEIKRCLLWVSN